MSGPVNAIRLCAQRAVYRHVIKELTEIAKAAFG